MVKNSKGITLIALVITIIVLLILTGVSLSLVMGNEGILGRAINAVDKSQKAAAEEELNLAMADMRMQAAQNNEKFDQNYIVENLPGKLEDCSCELTEDGIEGEYKDYVFTIDEKYIVQIESQVGGIKPEITAEVLTNGGVLEGEEVEVQVRATIADGSVTIQMPENMVLKSKTMETETEKVYVYTTTKNGNYTFTAVGDSGRKTRKTLKVNRIIDKPRISMSHNKGTSVVVNVENDYPENLKYSYYLGTTELISNSREKSYKIEELEYETEYRVKVIVYFNEINIESDELMFSTICLAPTIKVSGNFEKTPLEYPLFTRNGMMNCTTNLTEGTELTIEILNETGEEMTTYYSLDDGKTWKNDKKTWKIPYTENYKIKVKNVNREGEEFISQAIYAEGYAYDYGVTCTSENALSKKAYDGDEKTCSEFLGRDSGIFKFDNNIDIYQVCFLLDSDYSEGGFGQAFGYGGINFRTEGGELLGNNIYHTTYYGHNTTAWSGTLTYMGIRLYEIWYDSSL